MTTPTITRFLRATEDAANIIALAVILALVRFFGR
jgi:hypothetical protein